MRTTIDAAGRIVIPKKLRDKAGLTPGSKVEIKECDGRVEIEAIWEEPRLEWRGRFLVAVPPEGTPPLTIEEVEEVRRAIYEERARRAWGLDD
ncbi:MAG: AbrB/MazE/SpoVT family DNA-binding domain-containing protein, partial [Dehalococcoidia bacterium]